jgi:hypothetical protein
MKNNLICKIVTLVVAVTLSATSALAGSDSFNRRHLGTAWVVLSGGSLSISNHELVGTSGRSAT